MARPFRASFKVAALFACGILALISPSAFPENAPSNSGSATPITFGQAVAPLYGPWKFQVGDSPVDRATNTLLWAEPAFNDSQWETVDLTPQPGIVDPFLADPAYVQGWTAKGHPGYSGYAWYRIRVSVAAEPGERLAVVTNGVDDGYQLFAQGELVGSLGTFRDARQITDSLFHRSPRCLCCRLSRYARPAGTRRHRARSARRPRCWHSASGWDPYGFRITHSRADSIMHRCWARAAQSRRRIMRNGWN